MGSLLTDQSNLIYIELINNPRLLCLLVLAIINIEELIAERDSVMRKREHF